MDDKLNIPGILQVHVSPSVLPGPGDISGSWQRRVFETHLPKPVQQVNTDRACLYSSYERNASQSHNVAWSRIGATVQMHAEVR